MEKAKITNVLGDVIMVPQWQLQKSAMEKFASEHYGEVVICDPGLVYDGRVAVVWRCRSCVQQLKVLGYFVFRSGSGIILPILNMMFWCLYRFLM